MNISTIDSPRFQVFTEAGQVRVAPAPQRAKAKRVCNKPKEIPAGSSVVKIYGRAPGPYTLVWREAAGGPRLRAMRSDWVKAKKFAEALATNLANGQTAMNQFSEADRASYRRALELLGPSGKSLELACSIIAECVKMLDGKATPQDACRFFLEHRPPDGVLKNTPEIITELLGDLKGGIGARWQRSLESQLERFAEFWQGPLHQLHSADLNKWLRDLNVGARTRANYRAAVLQLATFAKDNGYLGKDWSELDGVRAPKITDAEIKTLKREDLVALLTRSPESLIPFLATAAFAGIRHEELAPPGDGPRLDWRNVNFETRNIYVPADVGKEGDRNVPMSDNLVAWLLPYRRPSGPVCRLANVSSALTRAKKKAGIPGGKNQTRNTLRKTFISCRLAIVKHIGQVAEEAGNSPAVIKHNYKRALPEEEAKAWFNVWPTDADIIQLPLKFG